MKLVLLHSSDTHGFLLPTDYQDKENYEAPISLSRVSSLVKAERKKYGTENVLVTDSGDCLQGSPLASYTHQLPLDDGLAKFTAAYNEIGYDARALGNHDFNFGLDYLKYYIDHNDAPIINDNILATNTDKPAFGQAYTIVEKARLKIGIMGITTQYISHWEPEEHTKGLKFVSGFKVLQKLAKKLRPQVDILVALYHGGFESDPLSGEATEPHTGENEGYKILTEIPEIDAFLTGHQHRRLNLVTQNTAIVQPGYRGEAVAKVVLEVEKDKNGQVSIKDMQTELIDTKDYEPDPAIEKIVAPLDKGTQEWLDQPIAHLSEPAPIDNAIEGRIKGAPFINLIQQMQLWFTKADISATAIMSETAKGFSKNVTMREVLLNYPYANQLCIVNISGKDLRDIIEYACGFLEKDKDGHIKFIDRWIKPKPMLYHFDMFYPVQYEADLSKPVGHRLTKLTLNGKEIEADKIYKLAVNNYRALGGGFYPGYSMDKIEKTFDQDYVQMFSEYLTKNDVKVDTRKNYKFY
ncbi:bifunctional metallophosphatase/5'-nucleotidase [Lactobacillus rodentium]|uniref:2', 3'-cyclic nucleotide 2'-phosphodiesterase n=1 Tax=Lactobacillus rodentium TaxID=947835 RepID=A0A2Z6TQF9_9LACO|nr:bifunctional UDP-sugar hydrolase/5'-nucleotidase [Lactobacillus rodentium]MCR1894725.1 bifunctional metallophosphatase/5'-nucleotidase [Lactobacillus rodentium]GBG05027.1 2', 3'-cyclic nucleotide 2'-phosphodiesterase [Lactobacillus rodentium]